MCRRFRLMGEKMMCPSIQISIGLCKGGLMFLCQRAPYARKQGGGLIPDVRNLKRSSPLAPGSEDGGHRAAVFRLLLSNFGRVEETPLGGNTLLIISGIVQRCPS
ncbi:MAG: hypothetical protein ACXVPC_11275 [Tumebacillaceae bacterium]